MPFKSEAQRRYLWANEPEIARDWTDTYGSGIGKALGGRIGFYRGSDRHGGTGGGPGPGGHSTDRGGSLGDRGATGPGVGGQSGDRGGSLGSGPHGGEWSGPTYSKPDTVTFDTGPHRGEGIGSQTFNKNLNTLQHQQQYQQGAYQRAHPFLSKVRSGLGSLGRGIGHVARNINPLSFATDNPLMKLMLSKYGSGNMRNLFQRNNQTTEQVDPKWSQYFSGMGITDPNALTRLQMEQGIMSPDINKYAWDTVVGEDNIYKDLVAQAKLNRREKTELGILQGQKEMESTYGPLTPEQEQRIKELLQKEVEV